MTSHAPRIPEYLTHILNAIQRIKSYTENLSQEAFWEDSLRQDAVIRNIEIIDEAAKNISKVTVQRDIPDLEPDIQTLLDQLQH